MVHRTSLDARSEGTWEHRWPIASTHLRDLWRLRPADPDQEHRLEIKAFPPQNGDSSNMLAKGDLDLGKFNICGGQPSPTVAQGKLQIRLAGLAGITQ